MNNMIKIVFNSLAAVFFTIVSAGASVLSIDSYEGKVGSDTTFTVSVINALNDADSLGFEVKYDASVLSYRGYRPGSLVQGFSSFNVVNTDFGVVRIGGFDIGNNKITKGASGSLVYLTFEVVGYNNSEMKIIKLLDDLKSWSVINGILTGEHQPDETEEPDNSGETTELEDNTGKTGVPGSDSRTGISNPSPNRVKAEYVNPNYANNHRAASLPGNNGNKITHAKKLPGTDNVQKKTEDSSLNKNNISNIRKKQENASITISAKNNRNLQTGLSKSEKDQYAYEVSARQHENRESELRKTSAVIYADNNGNATFLLLILILLVLVLILAVQILILIQLASLKRSGRC